MALKEEIVKSIGKTLEVTIERGEEQLQIPIKMYSENDEGKKTPITQLGVSPTMQFKRVGVIPALAEAFVLTYEISRENIVTMCKLLVGKMNIAAVGGVISIYNLAAQGAEQGPIAFIYIVAIVSIMLGVLNLLPIPVLDGGTVVFSGLEWMLGRPISKRVMEMAYVIGLVVILFLMCLGIWNDLVKCRFFSWVESLFK
jgi:regulator of sigma E protease